MSNFPTLKYRAQDNNGTVLPLATLTFYEAGPTTTKLGTWSNIERDVPNDNPVEADGDGYFPEIYLDPSLAYYIELRNAAGVLIWTVDNIYATALGSADLTLRIRAAGVSPTDFGAIGDGAADESGQVQDAIDAASASGSIVNLLGLTYRCDYSVSIPSNVTIDAGGDGVLDFTNCAEDEYIKCVGALGNSIAVSQDIDVGAMEMAISRTGLSRGDVLFISSSAMWRGGTGKTGELVVFADATEVLIPASPARDNYLAVSSAARKITPVEGVTLRGVTVKGSTNASGDGVLLFADLCRRVRFVDCVFDGIKAAGIRLNTCLDVTVDGCVFKDGDTGSIGVEIAECCEQVTLEECVFERIDTGASVGVVGLRGGVCRDVSLDECRGNGCWTSGVTLDQLSQNATLVGNEVEAGDVSPITLASACEVKLIANKVRSGSAAALGATGIVDGVLMSGNLFERADQIGPVVSFAGTAAGNISGINAVGNYIKGGTYGISGSNVASGTFARSNNVFTGQLTGTVTGIGDNAAVDTWSVVGSITAGDIVTTSTANAIPRAGSGGKLDAGWLPDVSGTYAPAAKGVTNGDSHDHNGGDGGTIAHGSLSDKGTNTHSTIDSHLGSTSNPHSVTAAQAGAIATGAAGAASGVATLDGSSKVVQEPASKAQVNGVASLNAGGFLAQDPAGFCAGRVDSDGTKIWGRGSSFTTSQTGTGVYAITVAGVTSSASVVVTAYSTGFTVNASPGSGSIGIGTQYGGSAANTQFFFVAMW
jgi:hypothetical protein